MSAPAQLRVELPVEPHEPEAHHLVRGRGVPVEVPARPAGRRVIRLPVGPVRLPRGQDPLLVLAYVLLHRTPTAGEGRTAMRGRGVSGLPNLRRLFPVDHLL